MLFNKNPKSVTNITRLLGVTTVEEIHEIFFTEVDRLLAEAQIQRQDDTIKKDLIEKAIRLSKLGFRDMGYDRNDEYPDSDNFGSEFLSVNPYSSLDDG